MKDNYPDTEPQQFKQDKVGICEKCRGRGWYFCSETHGMDGVEVHEDGRKECRRCGGTGYQANPKEPK